VAVAHHIASPTVVRISEVHRDTAAAQAGLEVGDIILRIGDTAVATLDDLVLALGRHTIGKPTEVEILRGAERRSVEVRPTELPSQG
jgi:serine protease Do